MNTLDDVLQYRDDIESAKHKLAMAEGGLKKTLSTLAKDFGCSTAKAGRNALIELKRRHKLLLRSSEEKMRTFENKWQEKITNASRCH